MAGWLETDPVVSPHVEFISLNVFHHTSCVPHMKGLGNG